jgi:hypothetical protein
MFLIVVAGLRSDGANEGNAQAIRLGFALLFSPHFAPLFAQ